MKRNARSQPGHLEPNQTERQGDDGSAGERRSAAMAAAGRLFRRPGARLVIVALSLSAVTLVLAANALLVRRQGKSMRAGLQLSQSNALLTAQQLDALFAETLKMIPQGGSLSTSHELLLDKWLEADEKFLADNEDDGGTRFERGVVHRRVAQCLCLKGAFKYAREHYLQSIALFESLSRDYPAVPSYIGEQVDTYVRLGWAMRMTGDLRESDNAFRQAMLLLRDERVANDPNYAPTVSYHPGAIEVYLLDNQVARALHYGAGNEVLSCLERIVDILRPLAEQDPEKYQGSLAEAEAKLKEAHRQFGDQSHRLSGSRVSNESGKETAGPAPGGSPPE